MKFIIIYNESLRSKLIYYNFIKKNKKKIHSLIKIPITNGKLSFSSKIKFYLKLIFSTSRTYLLFTFVQTIIYSFISNFFRSDLKHLCKSKKIKFYKLNNYPNLNFLKNINIGPKDIIFSSTSSILKDNDLKIKNLILNFHESDPRILRGSALYYQLALKNNKYFKTSVIEPNNNIDEGRIIKLSKKINIKDSSVFDIIIKGYLSQSKLIENINYKNLKKKYPMKNSNKNIKPFSFPEKIIDKKLKLKKKKIINLKNIIYILKLSIKKKI